MATESSRNHTRQETSDRPGDEAFQRREGGIQEPALHSAHRSPRSSRTVLEELNAARAAVQALELRPRARCRVSRVQTTIGCVITAVDEMLSLLLQCPLKACVGLSLSTLIAGPERRVFGDRARDLMEAAEGAEWETRVIAPGARVGVPVAITLERAAGGLLNWYIRDLSELRRAQARVMQLEQIASAVHGR